MSDEINRDRRQLLGTAAVTVASAQLGVIAFANAQSAEATAAPPPIKPGTRTSFGSLRQIDAGPLNVGYAEAGPGNGPAVVLLHGWPYDIHSFVDVAPLLASAGYRVVVPYLRGYGTTRFLSSATLRNGQQSALAQDIVDLLDALKIQKAILGGFDWGGAHSGHHRGSLAGTLQGSRLGEWLSHRQPEGRQGAVAAAGGVPMVVPILFRHRAR